LFAGRFITFEGGEGAGKSTQIARLARRLDQDGVEVVATREPGGSAGAERIRELLLDRDNRFGGLSETLLFWAARQDHLEKTILPALGRGAAVICDRFADSTSAYQGVAGNVPSTVLKSLERLVLNGLRPDATVILDIDAEDGLKRAALRRGREGSIDRFEAESLRFHRRIRSAFLAIAKAEPDRCLVIPASGPADAVEAQILQLLVPRLAAAPPPRSAGKRSMP
jgi:dTMP kinase